MFGDDSKNINPKSDFWIDSSYATSILSNENNDRLNDASVVEKRISFNLDTSLPIENSYLETSFINHSPSGIQQPSLSEEIRLNPYQKLYCGVCISNKLVNVFVFDFCSHSFCSSCLREYFELLINENKISKIKCMSDHCESKISEEYLRQIISSQSYEKFVKFSKRLEIINNPERITCPFPDCEEYAMIKIDSLNNSNLIENLPVTDRQDILSIINPQQTDIIKSSNDDLKKEDEFFVLCRARHKFCAECRSFDRHEQGSCPQINAEFLNYIYDSSKEHKRCPVCGIRIEKMIGCNHIVCTTCDKQWCWLCKEEFKPDHYLDKNSKCFGKMYQGSLSVRNLIFENYDWFNEQSQSETHNNIINLNRISLQKSSQPVNQSDSEFFVLYRKYFTFDLKKFRNIFLRLFYSIGLFILLVISNYAILTMVSYYLEYSFDYYNIRKNRLEKIKYKLINILISFCVWIFTYPYGILVALVMYIRSLYKYVCGVNLNYEFNHSIF